MKSPNVLQIILSTFGIILCVFVGLSSSHEDDNRVIEDLSDAVDELHELINETEELNTDIGSTSRIPRQNLDWVGPGNVGQITGVAVNPEGKPVIFHRGDRIWNFRTFDDQFQFREAYRGPIREDTVLTLNPQSGLIESSWGADYFFLPHGLHIDVHGNVWLTDVALHQVFKFKPYSSNPDLVLGETFTPGSDYEHFCQPTSVAVARTGEIIVADGYCNSRLMIFNPFGKLINIIPHQGETVSLRIPHALAILDHHGDVCVADRENMRVVCLPFHKNYRTKNIKRIFSLQEPNLGRVFAIAAHGNTLYGVYIPPPSTMDAMGFMIDLEYDNFLPYDWSPTFLPFKLPHAMTISPNGTELYVTEIGPNRIWKFDLPINSGHEKK